MGCGRRFCPLLTAKRFDSVVLWEIEMTHNWDTSRINALEIFNRDLDLRMRRIKRALANLYKPPRIMFTFPFGSVTYRKYAFPRRLRIISHGIGRTSIALSIGHIGVTVTTPKDRNEFWTVLKGWG